MNLASAMVTKIRHFLGHPGSAGVVLISVHYALFLTMFLLGAGLAFSDFDDGPTTAGHLGRAFFSVAHILAFPLGSLILDGALHVSPAAQHAVLFLNSVLWGSVLTLVIWRAGILARVRGAAPVK
jgi:hypothetical protein